MKKLVNGCLGNIYYATVNEKNRTMSPTGKTDVTDQAIMCVFQWFMDKFKEVNDEKIKKGENEIKQYSIEYEGINYELILRKKKGLNDED